ncbi:MAG: uracil-DNA glycosylase [Pseudoruegeria sp.]
MDFHTAKALLEWQLEMGVDEAISESPVNRFDLPVAQPKMAKPTASEQNQKTPISKSPAPPPIPKKADEDVVQIAKDKAARANSLESLKAALASFEHCELRRGARNLVFGDGSAPARVMIIGEAPDREEDKAGQPFVGKSGRLLNRMFDAIGMSRDAADDRSSIYITPALPWRPPHNRDAAPDEIAMLRPFLDKHIELVAPDALILMGNAACQMMLGKRGITRIRGTWVEVNGLPTLPMFHPENLLRNPVAKREAWQDLLSLKSRLTGN